MTTEKKQIIPGSPNIQKSFRAGFFTPNLIGGIVLGYIWQFVFSRAFVNIGESTGWGLFEISWLSTPGKEFLPP